MVDDNPFNQDTRELLSYQLFAIDFFQKVTQKADNEFDQSEVIQALQKDPAQMTEQTEKSQIESSNVTTGLDAKS